MSYRIPEWIEDDGNRSFERDDQEGFNQQEEDL